MSSSLRDIPGANRRTSAFRRRRDWSAASRRAPILIDPRASLYDRRRPPRLGGGRRLRDPRRRRIAAVDLLLGLGVAAVLAFLAWQLWSATRVHVDIAGIEDEGAITFERSGGLEVAIDVRPTGRLENAELLLDGESLEGVAELVESGFRWTTDSP